MSPVHAAADVLVIGEALIDTVDSVNSDAGAHTEHVGGSPANVAFGLATLGHPVVLGTWFGRDEHGRRITEACQRHGVRLVPGSDNAAATPVAFAALDADGRATYRFEFTWQLPAAAAQPEPAIGHLHTGSIAAIHEPGGSDVLHLVRALREQATISYDPNIRPELMGAPAAVRDRVEALVEASDIVKASDEDLEWLYPGSFIPDILRAWAALGPDLVVVTLGSAGAVYAVSSPSGAEAAVVPARAESVVDTVGAGDSFMAGLISGLLDAEMLGSPAARSRLHDAVLTDVRPALERAATTSAATVAQAGAYYPGRAEF